MGPDGPREEIQRAIQATGCELRPDPARGGFYCVDCPTYQARAELVDALAWRDGLHDGAVRELALAITRHLPSLDPESCARAVHAAVRDRIRYVGEGGDMIQDPIYTWENAAGDCDCHARLVLALLRSLGVDCAFCGFETEHRSHAGGYAANDGGPFVAHAVATWRRNPGEFVWLETTIPGAAFGEHPQAAADRIFRPAESDARPTTWIGRLLRWLP